MTNYELLGSRTKCARGCKTQGQHTPACTCTNECPDHDTHCKGCLPVNAEAGQLCRRCLDRTRDALKAIPELAAHAASRVDGKLSIGSTNTDATRRGTQAHAPSPSPAWDTAESAFQWALLTALACADSNNHAGPFKYRRDGVPAKNLTALIAYILANLDWYATDIPQEIHDEATSLRKGLERVTGQDRLVHRIKQPCPSCGRRTLVRDDGSDKVDCRNRECGRIWREGEFDWMAHVAVS